MSSEENPTSATRDLELNQERGGNNQQQTNVVRDLQLKRIISFLVAIISMASAIPLAFLNGAQDIRAKHSPTVIKAYNFLIWSTLLSPILLLMYALFRSGRSDRIDRNQNIYLISTITIPCALLIMTSFFSIILLNKEYSAVMSLIVIPVIAIICFLGYAATRKVGDNDSTDHESYKREQKKAFKFSTTISSMAITVQTGMIYASFKSPPLQALQSFQIGLSLFFLISTVGILVMMVTSIPLTTVRYTFWSGRPLIFVRCSSAFILGLLGLSAIALAMQFLGSLVSGVFLLVHVLIFVYFALEHFGIGLRDTTSANDLYKDPDNAGVIRYGITAMVSFNCGLLAAICVVSVGIAQQNYYINLWLRVCTFFQLLAIESGLIWIGLMFEPHYSEMCASIIEIFHFVSLLLEIVMIMAGAVMLFIVLS